MTWLRQLLLLVRVLAEDRQQLALENVALRHQLAVLKRSVKRPKAPVGLGTTSSHPLEAEANTHHEAQILEEVLRAVRRLCPLPFLE